MREPAGRRLAPMLIAFLLALNLTACKMNHTDPNPTDPLPRHQALKAFDPHRKDFTCKHEVDAVSPIDPDAEAWNQEGLYVTRFGVLANQKDWKKAEQLWTQAAERKHWKAMMNLASLYEEGQGEGLYEVKRNIEKSVQIVEDAMRLGIPAAYDKMGNYHSQGRGGVSQDASRAWAFWEKAADMGNPQALTHIGKALAATYDGEGFWGNMPIGIKMLDCAVSQGFGEAALELGVTLSNNIPEYLDYPRALKVLHDGVKFGSEKAANHLFSEFDEGEPIVKNLKDPVRARRYKHLADACTTTPTCATPTSTRYCPCPRPTCPRGTAIPKVWSRPPRA